jgi:hypothetical protein
LIDDYGKEGKGFTFCFRFKIFDFLVTISRVKLRHGILQNLRRMAGIYHLGCPIEDMEIVPPPRIIAAPRGLGPGFEQLYDVLNQSSLDSPPMYLPRRRFEIFKDTLI